MGLDEGQQPGAELLVAVQEAEAAELEVALIDRDIQTTLRRAWKKMGHAGAIVSGVGESAAEKVKLLEEAGVIVAPTPSDLGITMERVLKDL